MVWYRSLVEKIRSLSVITRERLVLLRFDDISDAYVIKCRERREWGHSEIRPICYEKIR